MCVCVLLILSIIKHMKESTWHERKTDNIYQNVVDESN